MCWRKLEILERNQRVKATRMMPQTISKQKREPVSAQREVHIKNTPSGASRGTEKVEVILMDLISGGVLGNKSFHTSRCTTSNFSAQRKRTSSSIHSLPVSDDRV